MSYLALALVGKRMEFLNQWLPQLKRVAVLAQPQHPERVPRTPSFRGGRHHTRPRALVLPDLGHGQDLDDALAAIRKDGCDAQLSCFPIQLCTASASTSPTLPLMQNCLRSPGWTPFAANGLLMTYKQPKYSRPLSFLSRVTSIASCVVRKAARPSGRACAKSRSGAGHQFENGEGPRSHHFRRHCSPALTG